MWKENNRLGMVLIVFCIISQISCKDDVDTSSRKKRYTPYSAPSNYDNSYQNNPYNSDYQPVQCATPPKCIPISALPNQNDPVKTNLTWLEVGRQYYQTGGSCWGYNLFAKIFLSRDVRTQQELEEMCLSQFFAHSGLSTVSGYGRQYQQNCEANQNDQGNVCTAIPGSGSDGTDIALETPELDYVVLTNSKSFILYYRCKDNHYADYMIFTTRPYVSKDDAADILDTLQAMGFDLSQVRFLSCEPQTYPFPLQNYLSNSNYPSSSSCSSSTPYQSKPAEPASEAYDRPPAYNANANYYAPPPASHHYPPNY